MKTKPSHILITFFFLFLFIGSKAFGYHSLLHDHDVHIEECDVRDKALVDQFSPLEGASQSIEINTTPQHFHEEIIEHYTSEIHTTELSSVLFSRPPPALN